MTGKSATPAYIIERRRRFGGAGSVDSVSNYNFMQRNVDEMIRRLWIL